MLTWGNDKEFLQNAFGWITTDITDMTLPHGMWRQKEIVIPCSQEKYERLCYPAEYIVQ